MAVPCILRTFTKMIDIRIRCFVGGVIAAVIITNLVTCDATFGAQCKEIGLTGLNYERCLKQKSAGTFDPDTFEIREP